jgi:hypothetical protein
MSDSDRISHVGSETCKNIKSRKNPKLRCSNPATHGDYCGIHFKHPHIWVAKSPETISKRVKRRRELVANGPQISKIQKWYRFWRTFRLPLRHGPGFWDRTVNVNDTDFFSTDKLSDIPNVYFFSFRDTDNHCYGFDTRSIHSILYRARNAGEEPLNPYTRATIPSAVKTKVAILVKWLTKRGYSTEWAPLEPPTPEQQWRMKVVDLFTKIDELNYYSSPDWFITLSRDGQRTFYRELHAIWSHRAGLSLQQKNTIVPQFMSRLFRHAPWALGDQSLESLQKINMNVIRQLITTAEDRNDRILGAMYVVSTLTLVNEQARNAYPWLYESVAVDEEDVHIPAGAPLFGWLNHFLAMANQVTAPITPPPLQLPPPQE